MDHAIVGHGYRVLAGLRNGLRSLFRVPSLGVRGLALDGEGRVLLVRHTYVPGWYFPGGGVGFRESFEAAIVREMREEAGAHVHGEPQLFGIYANFARNRCDHVAFFVMPRIELGERPARSIEIAEVAFFAPDALPVGTTAATRARIAEWRQGARLATGDWGEIDGL